MTYLHLSESYSVHNLKCPLIMRMQLACTLATTDGAKRIYSAKNICLYHCIMSFPILFLVQDKPYVNFTHSSNYTEHYEKIYCFISHAQNTTALQPNVFLTGTHLLLVTNKVWLPFPTQTAVKVNWTLHSQYLYVVLTATRAVLIAFVRRLLNLVQCIHDCSCKNDIKVCFLMRALIRVTMLLGIRGKYMN